MRSANSDLRRMVPLKEDRYGRALVERQSEVREDDKLHLLHDPLHRPLRYPTTLCIGITNNPRVN